MKTTLAIGDILCVENPSQGLQDPTTAINTKFARNTLTLADGIGLNQAHQVYSQTPLLAANGSETLNLNTFGGAIDALGNTYNLSTIKVILIKNLQTDPTAIVIVAPDNSVVKGFSSVNGSASNEIAQILPGGTLLLVGPSAAGYPVSATNNALKLANQSATVSAQLQVVIIGG